VDIALVRATTMKIIEHEIDDRRFSFGENWKSFLAQVDDVRIEEQDRALQWLVGSLRLDNLRFLDVGSGSGLSSLSARRLGASVLSFDYDRQSVNCAAELRARFFPGDPHWQVEQASILDRDYLASIGHFDVVHAWGVLHHTGAMIRAIENAAQLVTPGGLLVVALYRRTSLCPLWKAEKRWYSNASSRAQIRARGLYTSLMRLAFVIRGRNFADYVVNYGGNRGMDFVHDVHDWLGGYPYESIRPRDVAELLAALRFEKVRIKTRGYSIGLFGSGCDEYVYRRRSD
jgi:2-polyprenyl-3-methyl-5-hydroxy-6-metoxy-1,4-benzoquinol methylase